jgi:hypothetical protein
MKLLERLRILNANEAMRLPQLIVGIALVLVTPLVGLLPGPGGIVVFGIGFGLILRNSAWAKRRYVVFKRKQPKMGGWADWGLRRQSAKRRGEKVKQSRRGSN